MKKFIDIICKVKSHGFVEYLKYVGIFSFLIIGVYVFMLFAGMATTSGFTYAEFECKIMKFIKI